jgi:L-ascorbate metabolism protein UlaG (beta-lactamase superfamily)
LSKQRPTFTYLGHASVRIDLPSGEVVVIDPWVRNNPACPESQRDLGRLDAMLITHGHFDHMGDAVELARTYRPRHVIGSYEVCHFLAQRGVENTQGMNLGGRQHLFGMEVIMVRADHSSGILDEDGRMHDGGLAAGYVVRVPGVCTFYHSGDTALFSDMQLIGELYRPELAFLPIGDLFTMDPHQAARACRLLGVRTVIPIHWGTFPALTGKPESLAKELRTQGSSCTVVKLAPGESY